MTAGHCIDVYGGVNFIWDHDGSPNAFGRARYDTWKRTGSGTADVGLVYLFTAEFPTTKNQIHTGPGRLNAVQYSTPTFYQSVGYQVCRYGEHSNEPGKLACGTITRVDVAKPSSVPGFGSMMVDPTIEVSFDSIGGDSGGPMFAYLSGGPFSTGPVAAYGTHVHSDDHTIDPTPHGWYTPIDVGRAAYPNAPGNTTHYGYTVCITPSCTWCCSPRLGRGPGECPTRIEPWLNT